MKVYQYDNVQEFWNHTQRYLLRYEAEHNLLLGILHHLLNDPARYAEPPYLAVCTAYQSTPNVVESQAIEVSSEILAIAIQTPPHKLVLSKAMDLNALKLIVQDLQNDSKALPGVSGLVAEVEAFLQAWQLLTGQSCRKAMEMRIHQLTKVQPVATAKGHLRLATEGDRPLLLNWVTDFSGEIGDVFVDDPEVVVDRGLQRQSIHLWEDGDPVSWASGSQSLPEAARIGPVYTPPEYRRKGYATACVAALSQKLLDQGCDRCFLFTDIANPTSNHVYQQIGYHPICDWHDYSAL